MQLDFHYYATYSAAILAGYSHEESMTICYSDQFTDLCSRSYLESIGAPGAAATTQLQLEMMDLNLNTVGLQEVTRIWSSFHFLPYDLYAELPKRPKRYMHKYRLICNTNGQLLVDTVQLAKGSSLEAAGIAMHVLADTWAHRYFAGTPSYVINNTNYHFFELVPDGEAFCERRIEFNHNPLTRDDLSAGSYTNSLSQTKEKTIMNLGHGRAGHLPDYSFARYKYLPAWADFSEITKDNPADYLHAFSQMVYAMRYLRAENGAFETNCYADEVIAPYLDEIRSILEKRQLHAEAEWKAFGEKLSGREIEPFDRDRYKEQYLAADRKQKEDTVLGRYLLAAMRHKSMVTHKIYSSGNPLAGVSVDYAKDGFQGIRDFRLLLKKKGRETDE